MMTVEAWVSSCDSCKGETTYSLRRGLGCIQNRQPQPNKPRRASNSHAVIEDRLSSLHNLGVDCLRVLAEACDDVAHRRRVEEAKRCAKNAGGEPTVELARSLKSSENQGEVHGGERNGSGELDTTVAAKVEGGASIAVGGVDPASDPEALHGAVSKVLEGILTGHAPGIA